VLFGYPLDGVVLTIGCDKTTPAALMAAAGQYSRHCPVGRADAQWLA
jgi:dihydroxyacid dehydratase/phosphogluconate dehydratase